MYQSLKSLTLALGLTSLLYATETTKPQKTKEMLRIEALYSKLDKSAQEEYVSKIIAEKELRDFHKNFRELETKFAARTALLEKQTTKRLNYLKENHLQEENDEVLKKINEELSYITVIGNRHLQEAWKFFEKKSPELSAKLLSDFEKARENVTVPAAVALLLFKNIDHVSKSDNVALELILDIGRIPSSQVEKPELRQFSYKALEAAPNFDLVLFLVSGAIVADEITALD